MDEREMMAKIDQLRSRFNVSYARAFEVLAACDWDLVQATIRLEGEQEPKGFSEEFKVTGADLVETLKRLLHEGNISRVTVKDGAGREVLNVPVNGALAVALLLPAIAALGAVAVLAMDYTITVERRVR